MTEAPIRRPGTAALAAAAVAAVLWAAVSYGPVVAFHLLPPTLTGEAARLAELIGARPGRTIAEIGAGDGAFSMAMARRLQPGGTLYSTELDPGRLREIQERVDREQAANVIVVAAGEATTNLPDQCCDAVFMRNVYHHIGDVEAFNLSLRQAVKPGGRVAVIDFPPSTFGGDEGGRNGHGVAARTVAREMERAGFTAERIDEEWGGRTYLVLLRVPGGATDKTGRGRTERPAFALALR